jgi:hypothetical protein
MVMIYTATLNVKACKQHACLGCGGVYRYHFQRKKEAMALSREAAGRKAQRAVAHALEYEVDQQPCPHCGLYQPDMVGSWRSKWHFGLFACSLAALLVVVLFGLSRLEVSLWLGSGVAGLFWLVHLAVDLRNPNRNLAANQWKAERRVSTGAILVGSKGRLATAGTNPAGSGWSVQHSVAHLMLFLAILAFPAGAYLREAKGWSFDHNWNPTVLGPGDQAIFSFPDTIPCVNALWAGKKPTAQILNAEELGVQPNLNVVAKSDRWSSKTPVKRNEANSMVHPWVTVDLPADEKFAGKRLDIQLDLDVVYPKMIGDHFENRERHFTQRSSIKLVTAAHAGSQYTFAFWGGLLGASAVSLLGALWIDRLARSLCKRAIPTTVYNAGSDASTPKPAIRGAEARRNRADDIGQYWPAR